MVNLSYFNVSISPPQPMELDGGRARRQLLVITLLAIAFLNVVRIIYSTDP